MRPSPFRSLVALLGAIALLAGPLGATWSIVAINQRTGEVAVASATCLSNFNLKVATPVIVVGEGAAAAQSSIDLGAFNRMKIFKAFVETDDTPEEILDFLAATDPVHRRRQYGICAFTGPPVTFTGQQAGQGKAGVTGQVGDYVYAVQGNLLTGAAVVFAAEQAFVDTDGDMGQRLMAAMQAARAFGGDGRCSCLTGGPTDCGAPPDDFDKSAHVAYLIVARMGDQDGVCDQLVGCASGSYYACINIGGAVSSPDPVETLQTRYDEFRANRVGRPDGILSQVTPVGSLPADGLTKRQVTIQLVDLDGNPLTFGGADVQVQTKGGARAHTALSPVVDHGDGSYSFTLTAGTLPGTDEYVVTAADDFVTATLFPFLEVPVEAPLALHAGFDQVSASAGAEVPYSVNVPGLRNGRYGLLWRMAGVASGWTGLPGARGRLDTRGHAEGSFEAPPELLRDLVGMRMEWLGVVMERGAARATNVVGLDIVP